MRGVVRRIAIAVFGASVGLSGAQAEELRLAVAANFRAPCEVLARRFEASTGHKVVISVGSTGSLFAQIQNGAAIDVLLAGDTRRPAILEAEGRTQDRFTYAWGRVVLIGREGGQPAKGEHTLRAGGFTHLALANPETAPYGAAAREALQRLALWDSLEPAVVYGESVGQAYQFVRSGSAELGLVAWSQAIADAVDDYWLLPAALHPPIRQDAVLLTRSPAARAFFEALRSSEARAVIGAAGYGVNPSDMTPADPQVPPSAGDSPWAAIRLTVLLAASSTVLLLCFGTPLAWWLARGQSRWRVPVDALVALPLVLPPTVLGFYLLVLLGPEGPVGAAWEQLGGPRLVFSFGGLVIGSVLYSLPFVVQPLRNSFQAIDASLLEAAATLRASRFDRWRSVVFPLARPGFVSATVLGFAHTVGEFGVVLMIGGSVPGRTKVLSIAIYDHVEQLHYGQAHLLAAGMLGFSFVTLLAVYAFNRPFGRRDP